MEALKQVIISKRAELAARGLPSILVPYPYAAEDHQTYNARVFVAGGAAKMIVDKYLTAEELIQDITELKEDPEFLTGMAEASRRLGKIHAGEDIARMALALTDNDRQIRGRDPLWIYRNFTDCISSASAAWACGRSRKS